ncbi:hypothetical protein C491_21980 [Natronococcus amylolyticus DSM 10524]|uniref:Uncharacterized protein n=1 Tax=Natronococcus amylolyticus DSM 10524 TaxID=1227497 RepID=L9WUP4_9EURY|nr:DUF6735 family protein [Natronococcus amylolyticus]ELY53137.1 hypothetical protein C491_21980 [Natronococcus amylolyticus DSM 10524]
MGHRALVAYERPDRLYDLRYSHWGGTRLDLVDRIEDERPLADGVIEESPVAKAVAGERILSDFLDPCKYEALYLVREGGSDGYRVAWLEWDERRGGDRGAIVELEPGEADREFRRWFRATKTVLGDIVELWQFPRDAARTYLEARVVEEYDGIPYTYRGT